MNSFPLLEVILGLAFVYLLLALVCTTLVEWVAQLRNGRGNMLLEGTSRLLGEEGGKGPLTDACFNHPLVHTMRDRKRAPSYVPGKVFAKALRDTLARPPQLAGGAAAPSPELKRTLDALAGPNGGVPNEDVLAEWYDHAMERVSGTYKRKTRGLVLLIAGALTLALNANTLTLAQHLWESPTLRATVVERAKARIGEEPPLETVEYSDPTTPVETPAANTAQAQTLTADESSMLGDLFGWQNELASIQKSQTRFGQGFPGIGAWLLASIVGWGITALAISLGAPFWFDTLNKFMQVRSSGSPPPKSFETPKK